MSPDKGEHVTKGSGVLVILGRLSDRDLPIRVQRPPKERHEAIEAKEQRSRAFNGSVRPLTLRLDAQMGATLLKGHFNGAITNDKFCMTRQGRLQLSHYHLPLRLRSQHSGDHLRYPPSKKSFGNGGTYEDLSMEASPSVYCGF